MQVDTTVLVPQWAKDASIVPAGTLCVVSWAQLLVVASQMGLQLALQKILLIRVALDVPYARFLVHVPGKQDAKLATPYSTVSHVTFRRSVTFYKARRALIGK